MIAVPSSQQASPSYTGRFAPSPSGPLHMGSLVAALASFLDARANDGRWLLRMEDLDPPREPPGAAETILEQLLAFGMQWDGEVLYQSARHEAYATALQQLEQAGLTYPCNCTRQQIRAMGSVYDGHCRHRTDAADGPVAIRLRTAAQTVALDDRIQGRFAQRLDSEVGDFVIRRKDGLFAYQLAVVVDDAFQRISHIVRGHDLLDSTPRQLYLQSLLDFPRPDYAHIPVIVDADGEKLSKQTFAAPVDVEDAPAQTFEALRFLGLTPPASLRQASIAALLDWAIAHWELQQVPKLANIPESPAGNR